MSDKPNSANGAANGAGKISSAEASALHGGHWHNSVDSTTTIQHQLAQIQAVREAQAQILQLEAKRQIAIRALGAEADRAQADFIAAMRSSDYEAVAKAARHMSRCEATLVALGAYE